MTIPQILAISAGKVRSEMATQCYSVGDPKSVSTRFGARDLCQSGRGGPVVSFAYQIDAQAKWIFVRLFGRVTDAEIVDSFRRLCDDPAHDPALPRLIDGTEITGADASAEMVRLLAMEYKGRILGRTAFVAGSETVFGLFRMYELYSDDPNCHVFRDMEEAQKWLGCSPGT